MRFAASGLSAVGFQRDYNEDGVGVFLDDGVLVVCDGMGGFNAGSFVPPVVASAYRAGVRALVTRVAADDIEGAVVAMRALTLDVHETLQRCLAALGARGRGAGGAAGAVWLHGDRAVYAHAGDTRLYLLRGGRLAQVWMEHTLERMLQNDPAATAEMRAEASRYASVITMAFGAAQALTPDTGELPLREGDTLLLCSDGVWRQLREAQLVEALSTRGSPDACLDALFDMLERTEWSDNASAIVLRALPGETKRHANPAVPTSDGRDWTAGRWLRPRAPRAWEAADILAGSVDTREALERLCVRGMLPLRWSEDGVARYAAPWTRKMDAFTRPTSDVLTRLAADGDVVAQVEALAVELRRRLRPWGFAGRDTVVWTMLPDTPLPHRTYHEELRDWVQAHVDAGLLARATEPVEVPRAREPWRRHVCEVVAGAEQWCDAEGPVPAWNVATDRHPYADLPSPFEVLWEIAARGYLVLDVAREGVVVGVP